MGDSMNESMDEPMIVCDVCMGWYYFSVVGLTRTPEEMKGVDYTCPRCAELEELKARHELEVTDLKTRLRELEEREGGWQLPKKTATAMNASARPTLNASHRNSFSVLQHDEGGEETREVVIMGSSNVRRFDRFVRGKRRKRTKIFSFPGAKTKDLMGKIGDKVDRSTKTKVFLHVGTNDTVRENSEQIIKNLECLIHEAKDANAEVAVCSIPSRQDNGVAFSRAEGINNRLAGICKSNGAEFVDLRGYLVSCRHWLNKDGVHYSERGGAIVGERLGELIDAFLG